MIKTRSVNHLVYNYKATVLKVVEGNLVDVTITKGLRINFTNVRVKLANVEIPEFNNSLPPQIVKEKREKARNVLNYLVGGRRVLLTTLRPAKAQLIQVNIFVPCEKRCMELPLITDCPQFSEPFINVRNTMCYAAEKNYDLELIKKLIEPLEVLVIT